MEAQPDWTLYNIVKLLIEVMIPISVLVVGWLVNRKLKKIEHLQWANQKLIEKRLDLYDELAPMLNQLYCFYMWVGEWKDISPEQALQIKRALDKKVHVYRYLLGELFFQHYDELMGLLFKTFSGHGKDALLRSGVESNLGDRSQHASYEWKGEWAGQFTGEDSCDEIHRTYNRLMNIFTESMGIEKRELHKIL